MNLIKLGFKLIALGAACASGGFTFASFVLLLSALKDRSWAWTAILLPLLIVCAGVTALLVGGIMA